MQNSRTEQEIFTSAMGMWWRAERLRTDVPMEGKGTWQLSLSAHALLRLVYPSSRVSPPFPHRLSWGGEAPSGSRSLKAKTQRLVKCFEGDKPWWPDLVMLVTGVRHKWSVQDLLPPALCLPLDFLVCVCVCVCASPFCSFCRGGLMASEQQAAWNQALRFHL